MKKYLLLLIAIISCVASAHAQSSLVATLSHEGALTHYYGTEALFTAYNAAAPGDTITLSPGIFSKYGTSFTIGKTITIRGAGYNNACEPTVIKDTKLYIKAPSEAVITLEGFSHTSQGSYYRTFIENLGEEQGTIKILNCDFLNLDFLDGVTDYEGPSVRIYNSVLHDVNFGEKSYSNVKVYSSLIENPKSSLSTETSSAFINCIIQYNSTGSNQYVPAQSAYYLNFYNCIFNWRAGYSGSSREYLLPATASCENCLSINKSLLFRDLYHSVNNRTVDNVTDVFKTYTDGYDTESEFELTEAAKAEYIGSDGTEIGMHGGLYPFTTELSYPIVSTFNVEPKTTKEGILTVEVAVDGK